MGIYEHVRQFGGKPVVEFRPGTTLDASNNYRIRRDYEDEFEFTELFARFVSSDSVDQVTGLVTGGYSDEMYEEGMGPVIEAIIASAQHLPSLTSLFIGDITGEENEISWIVNSDVSPIWKAFPRLQTFQIRGGNGLSLGKNIVHDQLQSLTIQTGGLPANVILELSDAELPELKHLELWLGEENYGGNSTIGDIKQLLFKDLFPKLKYLGLMNCPFEDEIAKAVVESSILPQLEVLDLSMGTLTDEGGAALLANADKMKSLKKLDLSHHYLSADMEKQLQALSFEVDTSERGDEDEYDGEVYRYIAVSE